MKAYIGKGAILSQSNRKYKLPTSFRLLAEYEKPEKSSEHAVHYACLLDAMQGIGRIYEFIHNWVEHLNT